MAAFYAVLFIAAFAILITAMYGITDRALRRYYMSVVDTDISAVSEAYQQQGLSEAIELIEKQTVVPGFADFFLLQDGQGHKLAGNLNARTAVLGEAFIPPPAGTRNAREHGILGKGVQLTSGLYLFAGVDTYLLSETREAIIVAFLLIAAPTLLLALGAGFLFNTGFLRRVDAITKTCRAIMAGRFGERVPSDNSGGEIASLSDTINSMLDRINSLMENLREVSSAAAHDMRTPLTRLRQKLERARQSAKTPEDFQITLDQSISDVDEILEIFSSLLNLSRIESGARVAAFAPVSLKDLLTHVAEIYAPLACDQDKNIETEFLSDASIMGDRMLLMQLFSNLVENAIHHTSAGTRIRLTMKCDGQRALVSVSDNGGGISPDDREKVFHRFWRGDASRGRPGHGLGLSIAAAIATLHEAQISLGDAEPGLTVSLQFSLARS